VSVLRLLYANDSKIFKYNNDYYSNGNYSKKILLRYANLFDEIRFVSRVMQVNIKPDKSPVTTQGVTFVRVPNFKSIKKYYKKLEAIKIIKKEVRAAECVIARLPSSIGSIAVKYAKKYKKPYLVEIVACTWDSLRCHRNIAGKIIAPYSFLKIRSIVRNAPYVLYVTDKFLQKRYPSKGLSIGCSDVCLQEFNEGIIEKRINKIKNMKENAPIILGTIGDVNVRYKGQKYVIKAISELNKEGCNFEYHLVGSGDDTYLRTVAKKLKMEGKIKFLGILPHDQIFSFLDNIDIYIQPSNTEGLPRALIEAMSRGCPALGSDAGGIPELIDKDFIFHKGSVKEICRLLKKMDKSIMLREARRNYEKAKEYDESKLNQKRNDFYNKFKNSIGWEDAVQCNSSYI